VHDPVGHGLGARGVRERVDGPGLVVLDEMELDARRAGVDD
jgi:hypothetical protein